MLLTSIIQKHVLKPIIWIKNRPEGTNVTFHPDAGTFKKAIEKCIIEANEIVQNNQPLKKIPHFGQFFDSFENDDDFEEVEDKPLDLFKISLEEPRFHKALDIMKRAVDWTFKEVDKESKKYLPYLKIYEENENTNFEILRHATPDVLE